MRKGLVTVLALALAGCVQTREMRVLRSQANPGRRHVKPAPTAVQANMDREIRNAVDLGDGDLELRRLHAVLLREPNDLQARMQLVHRYTALGHPDLAVEHLRLAAERFPQDAGVTVALIRALRDENAVAAALDIAVNFCNRAPSPPAGVLELKGILQDESGELAAAEQSFRAALLADGTRASAHNNLGYNLMLQGRNREAVPEFREALRIRPRLAVAQNNLAMALLQDWKSDAEAIEALLLWEAASGPAAAHNNMAAVLMDQHRYAEARKELDISLGYQKHYEPALRNLQLVAGRDGMAPLPGARTKDKRAVILGKKVALSEQSSLRGSPAAAGASTAQASK